MHSFSEFGKGWPHYKGIDLPYSANETPSEAVAAAYTKTHEKTDAQPEPTYTAPVPVRTPAPRTRANMYQQKPRLSNSWRNERRHERHYYEEKTVAPQIPIKSATSQAFPQNDILFQLEPIVKAMLEKFGYPNTHEAFTHLTDQIIAKAMVLPDAAASMRAKEMSPWGRAPLLKTVVELMIMQAAPYKRS